MQSLIDAGMYEEANAFVEAHGRDLSDNADYNLSLARLHLLTGAPVAALEAANVAVQRHGLNEMTLGPFGAAAILNDRQDIAARCYAAMGALPPRIIESILHEWSGACAANSRYKVAALLLKSITDAKPHDLDLKLELASLLISSGGVEGVEPLIIAYIADKPNVATGYGELARYRLLIGDADGAREAALKALSLDEKYLPALRVLSDARTKNVPAGILAPFEKLLEDLELTNAAAAQIAYSLGAFAERAGNFDLAFKRFRLANERQRATFRYDGNASFTSAWRDRFTKINTLSAGLSIDIGDEGEAAPVFIIGMPRSGTTLLEQALSMHPGVWAGGERPEIPYWIDKALALNQDETNAGRWIETRAPKWRTQFLRPNSARPRAITDKTPGNFEHLAFIAKLFPNARILRLIRDPRDVAISIYTAPFRSGVPWTTDIGFILEYYRFYLDCIEAAPPVSILTLRYEQLVDDFEGAMRLVLTHCGLSWAEECLEFNANARPVATMSAAQVRAPLYRSSIGRWRQFEHDLAPYAQAFATLEKRQQSGLIS